MKTSLWIACAVIACPDGAIAYERIAATPPHALVDHLGVAVAREYYEQGRLDDAEHQLRAIAKRTALSADGLMLAGDLLRERGDWPGAEAAFRTAIAVAPGIPELHLRLGQALQLQKKLKEADVQFALYVKLMRGAQP